jgi:hypothetical protein
MLIRRWRLEMLSNVICVLFHARHHRGAWCALCGRSWESPQPTSPVEWGDE